MKAAMGLTRLAAASTKGLAEIMIPSMMSPFQRERMFIFPHLPSYPDGDEGVDITLEASTEIERTSTIVSDDVALWPDHAQVAAERAAHHDEALSGCKSVCGKADTFKSLHEFLVHHGVRKRKRDQTPTVPEGTTAVAGAAAGEYSVEVETPGADASMEASRKDFEKDLTDSRCASPAAKKGQSCHTYQRWRCQYCRLWRPGLR